MSSSSSSGGGRGTASRVVVHVDCDAFYCQVTGRLWG
jgi:hypothetical protein